MSYLSAYDCILEALKRSTNVDNAYPSEAFLQENAKRIMEPPKTSCIRINSLKMDSKAALETARDIILLQDEKFLVRNHERFRDLVLVDALGPFEVVPAKRKAIVSVECAQSVLRGSVVFAPGLLAIADGADYDDRCVSVWADLEGKCTRGFRKEYLGKTYFIGNGLLWQTREQLFNNSSIPASGIAVKMTKVTWKMPSFDALPRDSFYPQNFPSFLTVEELEVQPMMTVLDMCAAPGGKTSHIAAKLENKGLLIAIDKNKVKVARLDSTLSDLGVTCAKTFVGDSVRICSESGGSTPLNFLDTLLPFSPGSFDRILLDPPCSGLGQRPVLSLDSSANMLHPSIAKYQKRLLSVAAKLLKPGGLLVYSTCSLTLAEDELIVKFAVEEEGLILQNPLFSFGSEGISLGKQETTVDFSKVQRFWPAGRDDSIGFFYAKLMKPA